MENVLVSARVTQAKKDALKGAASALGVTTSEVINRAFDYVIANRELPALKQTDKPSKKSFEAFVLASTLDVAWGAEAAGGDYRSILREGKRAAYESLA